MLVRIWVASLAVLGSATVAAAQEAPVARSHTDDSVVLTAPPAPPPAPSSKANAKPASASPATAAAPSDPTGRQIAEWIKADDNPVQPLDPHADILDGAAPRQIHGEVGAFVSNRGYGGYAATAMPIGQASELDLAVSGAHVRTPWGNANPRSIAVGLRLDGGDVGRWLSRDKCNVPRWGVSLKGDPEVLPDGSCVKGAAGVGRIEGAPEPAR
jgi:hypothetical protein